MQPQAIKIVKVPPNAQIIAITILAFPLPLLGRYSKRIITHCGMHDMQQPHRNLKTTNQVYVGENAVISPSNNRRVDDVTKDIRRPYASEMNPQTGDEIAIAINTDVVKKAASVVDTAQELHLNAGAITERIIISIASATKAIPAATDS
jgi:hypothetical protein